MSFTSCANCLHCSVDLQGDQANSGGGMICRRYPPVPVPITVPHAGGVSVQIHAIFPPVKDGSRCGEFEAAPIKIDRTTN